MYVSTRVHTIRRLAVGLLVLLVAAAAGLPTAAVGADGTGQPNPRPGPVVVSLTFDDGLANQMQAATLMEQQGMRGTFYINSGRLGGSGYLDLGQATSLQARGHEIGGHTVSHADLPTLSTNEAKRQVCNDRLTMLDAGLRVKNFAYPYANENPAVQQIVADCGLNSARVVGDIVSPGTCQGCAYAETVPPAQPYMVRTPDSIKEYTTPLDMENYVLQAEQNGGGWVVLVMHNVCDGCDPNSVDPAQLSEFLAWLARRTDRGTVVKTVDQVIGGTLQPGVAGPPPPPPAANSNLVRNPSMESLNPTTGAPECWQRGGFGTNSYLWETVADAREGQRAQRVTVSGYVSGDRKMITPQDLGSCAPPTVPGHRYRVRAWYKTNAQVRPTAYYRNARGGWAFLGQGPIQATSSTWAATDWTTPPMPADSTAISVGYSVRSNGSLTADAFTLTDVDQTPPSVALTAPVDGSRVRGTVQLAATADDESGIDRVEFLVDGTLRCADTQAPYTCNYDTTSRPDSVIAVTARAVDTARNETLSAGRAYTVSNSIPPDTQSPQVSLTAPPAGSTVAGTVSLTASATDNDAVNQVFFLVNDVEIDAVGTAPYATTWDTTALPDGPAVVEVQALDASGNIGTTGQVSVVVDNAAGDTTPPQTTMTCDGAGCGTDWYSAPVTVRLGATDEGVGVDRIVYSLDGTTPTLEDGIVYDAPFSLDRSATVNFRAYDRAGNAEDVQSLQLRIDTVAPTAAITTPTDGATVTGTTYIWADAADNEGVVRVWFYLDGKALGSRALTTWRWKWDTATTTKGPHTLTVAALDAAGNRTVSAPVQVNVG